MSTEKSLSDYRTLLAKVSAKFDEVHARHKAKMACGRGCSACCAPGLSVFAVERENIQRLIHETPGLEETLRRLQAENPHGGERCLFLDENQSCAVYEARPIICRSHGAPIFSKADGEAMLDVCPLNFQGESSFSSLKSEDFINIDLLNQLLALVNQAFDPNGEGRRFPLTASGILDCTTKESTGEK